MRSTRNISIDSAALAARLSALRRARSWTKQELADASGLSERTVRLLEQGQRTVVLEKTLLLLAQALAVTPEDLLGIATAVPEAEPAAEPDPVTGPVPAAEPAEIAAPAGPVRRRRRVGLALAGFLGLLLVAGTGFGLAVRTMGGVARWRSSRTSTR